MNIKKIVKDTEVVVSLSRDELVKLCNVMYNAKDEDKNNLFYQMNSEMIAARDMCQYGHIDDFSLQSIMNCRNQIDS